MEIEVKPISLNDRLVYLQRISENQQVTAKKFPWVVIVLSFMAGAVMTYAITEYFRKKKKDMAAIKTA